MDDLRAVMDAAGSERAALFGVSEGGPMCQLFAATFPERVTALVLYGTYAAWSRATATTSGCPSEMLTELGEIMVAGVGEPGRPSACSRRAWPRTSASATTGAGCCARRRARSRPWP